MPPSGSDWINYNNNTTASIEFNHDDNSKQIINTSNNKMNNHANGSMDDDVIGSLGKVLSSVNLQADVDGSGHHSNASSAPGSGSGAWTGLANSNAAPAPSSLAYNHHDDSIHHLLNGSGIYGKDGAAAPARPSTPPSNYDSRERKPSLDMFLSQSPSKALGDDSFLSMSATARRGSVNSNNGGFKPMSNTAPSSRSESPVNSRTGSAPAPGGQYYASQFNNAPGNVSLLQGQLPQGGNTIPTFPGNEQQPQYAPMPVNQQQPQPQQQQQVFYMAVAGPDGKQVLQPMQMVQMPGQAATIMMPVQQNQGNGGGQQPPVMMMQSVPQQQQGGNNGMGNANYVQENHRGGSGGNANGQYEQYGLDLQPNGNGYGSNNYQAKGNMDNVGGAQYDQGNPIDLGPNGSLTNLYSSPQRPPLRALLGNVRRLSRDQVGCRLLQQALDEDGATAATAILNEGLTFWAEAMVDPFGNYLFQKILERITPDERVTLVKSVSTRLVNASLNLHGTRSVQKIVEVCAIDEEENEEEEEEERKRAEEEAAKQDDDSDKSKKKKKKKDTAAKILTDALKPAAARLCIDSHGNHAIQRILLKLPYQYTQFIFDAVAASVEDVARHRHGCCVIQRCLDSRHSAARTHLVTRIVEKSFELMQDAYGNYVVQYVLDVCGDDEVHAICESVIGKVCLLAIQKFSSNVMEKCLERCTDRVREEYLNELNDSDRIRELMMDPFGNYVVQRALSVSTHAQAIRLVETMKPHLSSQNGGGIRNTAGGRRILGKICRRFPNFVLEGESFEDYDLNQVLNRGNYGQGRGQHYGKFNNYGGGHGGGPPNHHHRGGGGGGRNNYRGRGGHGGHHHMPQPQYQMQMPQGQPMVSVQQPEMAMQMPAYQQPIGSNPYMFPHSM
mmetsp:Transcript_27005/g.53925  ORF Transcript_27005/g.53925 Transcript_27005/m.53925 type:complete len:895 (-) Transcript_27005:326-3010(-)